MNSSPFKLSAAARQSRDVKRIARKERFERLRPQGDGRGWQPMRSGGYVGVAVWQLVEGGEYQEFVQRGMLE